MLKYLLFSGPACLAFSLALQAQQPPKTEPLPDYSKEGVVIENDSTRVKLENDGTQTRESSARVRIQSEAGVQHYGLLYFRYQSSVETVDIDYVRTRKPDGSTVATPAENIQDMAADITREAPFYSDVREKHVAVKGLGVGDVLEYQAHWQSTKPLVPGQFWFAYNFSHDTIILQEQLQVSVPRDRAIKWNSPDIKPTIGEDGTRRVFTWTGSNLHIKSTEETEQEEEKNAYQAARGQFPPPQIEISSFQTWEEVGHWYATLQQDRVQPSPEIRAKAAELTKGASDDDARLRAIYTYVSTQFRYIGIAFGIGRYQPHTAAAVLDNQYGDCKDKHTLLASLLQAAGIPAYPALINSSRKLDVNVPSPVQFDHVITVVPRGKDFLWLDTTTEVGPFGYLVTTLRDKPALVMPAEKPALFMTTPADPPFPSSVTFKAQGTLSDAGVLDTKMEETARGDGEVLLRTAFRRVPQAQWKDLVQNISYGAGFGGTVSEIVAGSPEATDSPFRLSYSYNRKDYSDWENRRISPPFPALRLPALKDDQTKFSQPLWWGAPGEVAYVAEIEMPKGYSPELPAAVDAVRDFAEYHASYTLDHGVLTAKRRLVGKLREVPISEFEQYKSFRKAVEDDLDRWIVLASRDSAPSLDTPASIAQAIWSLPDSNNPDATGALSRAHEAAVGGDLQGTVASLERSLEADPKFTKARILLAQTQLQMGLRQQAVTSLQTAVDNDPQGLVARKMLAFALAAAQRPDDAIRAWQEFLKIAPEDAAALSALAPLLMRQKRYSDAVGIYESALKLRPADPFLSLGLGTAYLRSGQKDKGTDVLQSAIKLKPGALMENNVGYELADANVNLPEALQHAQHAVRMEEEASQKVKLDGLQTEDLGITRSLAAYWDTLGWAYFRLGKLQEAEDYLSAAWELGQHADIADHLGQVYEQDHKREAAIHMYRLALAVTSTLPETRERLERLTGSGIKPDSSRVSAPQELSEMRTVKLDRLIEGAASAEFFLILAPGPRVEEVKFISGSEKLRSAGKTLAAAKLPEPFPQGSSARLVRRGILGCYAVTGCSFVLYTPGSVHSVD